MKEAGRRARPFAFQMPEAIKSRCSQSTAQQRHGEAFTVSGRATRAQQPSQEFTLLGLHFSQGPIALPEFAIPHRDPIHTAVVGQNRSRAQLTSAGG